LFWEQTRGKECREKNNQDNPRFLGERPGKQNIISKVLFMSHAGRAEFAPLDIAVCGGAHM
jgi:hypothetical protein